MVVDRLQEGLTGDGQLDTVRNLETLGDMTIYALLETLGLQCPLPTYN
jgi:hypothetical protein